MTSSNLPASVLAVGILCLTSTASGQELWQQPSQRQYNGWSAAGGSAHQSVGVQVQQAMYQAPGNSGNLLGQSSNAVGSQIRPIQPGYATGAPFVSPPPAPRVGAFPTSPYQSWQYQQISYPGATVARPAQFQTPGAQQASVLPQNQPVVGIYPTAYQNCAPGISAPSFPAAGAVPGTFAPPTLPPNLTPGLYSPDNGGYTPLISLGQENYNVLLGRGIVGQPTVYVPGQPFRNFLRYLSP